MCRVTSLLKVAVTRSSVASHCTSVNRDAANGLLGAAGSQCVCLEKVAAADSLSADLIAQAETCLVEATAIKVGSEDT